MNRIILCVFALSMLFSCAEEPGEQSTVSVDSKGIPLPCDLIGDNFLVEQFPDVKSTNRTPEELENDQGQMCRYELLNENDQRIGQMVLIVKQRNKDISREAAASRAKNTEYLEDMPFPASYRSFSNLNTLVFDYGNYTLSLNLGIRSGQSKDDILNIGKETAKHVVNNLKGGGFEENKE